MTLALAAFVLIREHGWRIKGPFCVMTAAAAIWLLAFGMMYCAREWFVAGWWAKIGYLGVPCLPSAVYQFTATVLRIDRRVQPLIWLSWIGSAIFAVVIIGTDLVITGMRSYWWGHYPQYGWGALPYLAFFFGMTIPTFQSYWVAYHRPHPTRHRRRIKALLIAFAIGYLASVDFVAKFGIAVYPFGYFPVFGFLVLAALAIKRYRLVDFSKAFGQSRQVLEAMREAVLVVDLDGLIRLVNSAACGALGYPERELVGQPIKKIVRSRFEGDVDPHQLLQRRLMSPQTTIWRARYHWWHDLAVTVSALEEEDGFPAGIVYTGTMITRPSLAAA